MGVNIGLLSCNQNTSLCVGFLNSAPLPTALWVMLALKSVANSNELSFLRFSLTEKGQWVKELSNQN